MKNKRTVMASENELQRYIDQKAFIKIYRKLFEHEENISGFILSMTKDFILIQTDNEFKLDGFAIIKKGDYERIRHSSFERTIRKIFKAEGLLNTGFGLKQQLNMESWTSIFKALKKQDVHIILESEHEDYLDFHIGPIVKVNKKSLSIHNYNPNGIYDNKPTTITFEKIRTLKFGDNYSVVFRKYIRSK
jgi:hypothetical protein